MRETHPDKMLYTDLQGAMIVKHPQFQCSRFPEYIQSTQESKICVLHAAICNIINISSPHSVEKIKVIGKTFFIN